MNDYFINTITKGYEDVNYLKTVEIGNKYNKDFLIHESWINKIEFIGLNYYLKMIVYDTKLGSLSSANFIGWAVISNLHTQRKKTADYIILNDLGWEIYPIGLYNMAIKIHIIENENQFCNNSVHRQSIRYVNYLGTEKLVRVL